MDQVDPVLVVVADSTVGSESRSSGEAIAFFSRDSLAVRPEPPSFAWPNLVRRWEDG